MSLPATIQAVVLDTILARLIPLFLLGANGDPDVARQAVVQLLSDYGPQTDQELILAAESISHSLHCLETLSQSMDPDLSLPRKIRLRGSAVSLNRESHRSRQKLEQLQRARGQLGLQPAAEHQTQVEHQPAPDLPRPALPPPTLAKLPREALQTATKQGKHGKYGGLTYTQDLQRRMTAKRRADKAARRAAEDRAKMALAGQPENRQPQNGQPQTGQPLPDQPRAEHACSAQPQAGQPRMGQHATAA